MKRTPYLLLIVMLFFLACQNESQDVTETDATEATDNSESSDEEEDEDKPIEFNVPDGFTLEDLYMPKEHSQGSWVALAEGPDKTLYACDQRGDIYKFKIPDVGAVLDSTQVDSVDLEIGHAHGLLWAFNSLYVAVNKGWDDDVPDEEERGSGIYRLTDTNNDGELDKIDMLLKLDGAGEHGPHSFLVGPSGKDLYFIAGNHVTIPEGVKRNSRLPNNWDEDNLFTPYLDARGHATDIEAPGGWVVRFDSEGKNWDLISAGYRNPFDFAFNQDGELFVYDADMEWDIGMPWYRPTRILHATSGSEFGWRTGSGKWPHYYPDALPAAHNLEQGSPTGVLIGTNLDFPARYKNGMFIMDWSFGTMYFLELKPSGSTYTATREEFLSGTPLPLTDLIAGSDGHMYFASGGRNLKSHLFRLRYTGGDKGTAKLTADNNASALRQLRKSLEAYHTKVSNNAISLVWKNLNHADRHVQYAARVALEHQSVKNWQSKLFSESDTEKILQASIALAHQGSNNLQGQIIDKLTTLNWSSLNLQQKLSLVRAYQLLCIRMGMPDANGKKDIIEKLKAHFPDSNNDLTREISQLMVYLEDAESTATIMNLLEKHTKEKTANASGMLSEEVTSRSEQYGPLIQEVIENMPPSEAIYYSMMLSHAKTGWTDELREKYFQWYFDVMSAKGGLSMKPFLENMKEVALAKVPEDKRQHYRELSGVFSPTQALADVPEPIGPGGTYNAHDVNRAVGERMKDYQGTIEDGKRAYQAALCGTCHRMKGEGGSIGPDLTQAHTKFNRYDMTIAIFSPNDEISDQYAYTLFHTKDGKKIAGRIMSEKGDKVEIQPNPYNTSYTVSLAKSDITKKELSPVSPMPPGLLNRLNKDELAHLFAYLMSGGDENDKIYTGEEEEEESD